MDLPKTLLSSDQVKNWSTIEVCATVATAPNRNNESWVVHIII